MAHSLLSLSLWRISAFCEIFSKYPSTVDLTTTDPWTGNFTVPKSGLWRFTLSATAFADSYVTDSYTYVYLNVDGVRRASGRRFNIF